MLEMVLMKRNDEMMKRQYSLQVIKISGIKQELRASLYE